MPADKTFTLDCMCGCSKLRASYWDFPNTKDLILTHYTLSFGEKQRVISTDIKETFKMIWCAITGKRYSFYELVITQEQLAEFKKFVEEL
jgi:hypothetical protein